MSPPEQGKQPKISAQAEAKARKRREELLAQQTASLQKTVEVGAQFAAAVASRFGLEKQEEPPGELMELAKKMLAAEAPPSKELLSAEDGKK